MKKIKLYYREIGLFILHIAIPCTCLFYSGRVQGSRRLKFFYPSYNVFYISVIYIYYAYVKDIIRWVEKL